MNSTGKTNKGKILLFRRIKEQSDPQSFLETPKEVKKAVAVTIAMIIIEMGLGVLLALSLLVLMI